jgi:hemoglobin
MASIYEEIGGQDALIAVVDDFYDRVLADPALTKFFTGANMARLRGMQVEFFAGALGGPDTYRGRTMKDVHRGMGVEQRHFDLVAGHLNDALAAAGVPADTAATIIDTVAPLATDIVATRHR